MRGLRPSVSSPTRFCCLGRFYLPAHRKLQLAFERQELGAAIGIRRSIADDLDPSLLRDLKLQPAAACFASPRRWRVVRRQGDGIAALW